MTDQLSPATVATPAPPQVFGFLFGRLGEALDRRVDEVGADAVARGVKARHVSDRAAVDIEQTARTVRPGGELTGLDVGDTLG
ncbi:hypothetical protein ABZW47_00875 [Streptomyces sp. NPDC004549]|uniref:hypothetical protein n=1 Tax=Streptomyces sp. NPDC004549 TaxID=3154283 RepID=UPI0033BBCB90